jgi:hypothetical protein
MKIIAITLLTLLSSTVLAQNMKPISLKSASQDHSAIRSVLSEDDTDSIVYNAPIFTCHNFSKTLYLQRSSLVANLENYDLEGIKIDWGNIILRDENSKKLPIYILTLSNTDHGFYHSINAILINPEAPLNIESYLFVEPQTDEIFESPKDLVKHYSNFLNKPGFKKELLLDVGLFTKFIFTGTIYQSHQDSILKFQATL